MNLFCVTDRCFRLFQRVETLQTKDVFSVLKKEDKSTIDRGKTNEPLRIPRLQSIDGIRYKRNRHCATRDFPPIFVRLGKRQTQFSPRHEKTIDSLYGIGWRQTGHCDIRCHRTTLLMLSTMWRSWSDAVVGHCIDWESLAENSRRRRWWSMKNRENFIHFRSSFLFSNKEFIEQKTKKKEIWQSKEEYLTSRDIIYSNLHLIWGRKGLNLFPSSFATDARIRWAVSQWK